MRKKFAEQPIQLLTTRMHLHNEEDRYVDAQAGRKRCTSLDRRWVTNAWICCRSGSKNLIAQNTSQKYLYICTFMLPQCANVSSRRVDRPSLRVETVAFSSLPSLLRPTTSCQSVRENDFEVVEFIFDKSHNVVSSGATTCHPRLWYVLMCRARAADVLAKHVELRPYPCGPLAPQQNTGSAPKLTQHPQQAVVPNRWWHEAPSTQKRKQMHTAPLHHMAATTPLTTQCTARINLSTSTPPILVVHAANTCLHDVLGRNRYLFTTQ